MFCSRCGKKLSPESLFCSNCGRKIDIVEKNKENLIIEKNEKIIESEIENNDEKIKSPNSLDKTLYQGITDSNDEKPPVIISSDSTNSTEIPEKESRNFIDMVKNDIKSSNSIKFVKEKYDNFDVNKIKTKVSNTAKNINTKSNTVGNKKFITIVIIIIAIITLTLATHIHQCEECNKVYFGNKHTISFWGQSEIVCKDCYNDFYSW